MRTRPNFCLSSVFLRGLAVLLCPLLLAGCSVSDALDSSAAGTPDNAPPESEYSAWMPLPLDEDLPAAAVPSVDSDAQSAAPSADTAAPPANTTTDKTFPLTVSVQRAGTIISQQEWDTLLRPHALRSYYRFAVQPVAWQDADTFGTPELREQFLQAVPDVDSRALRFVQGAYCEDETGTLPAVLAVLYQPDAACWHLLWQRPSIGIRYLT